MDDKGIECGEAVYTVRYSCTDRWAQCWFYSICYQQRLHNEKAKAYLVTSKEALGLQGLAGHAEKA